MTDYKAIIGKGVKVVTTNLDNAEGEGQIWFNSVTGEFKDIVNVNIPTGIPLAFNVQDDKVSKIGYLGEQEQIKKLQKEVEQQSRITKG